MLGVESRVCVVSQLLMHFFIFSLFFIHSCICKLLCYTIIISLFSYARFLALPPLGQRTVSISVYHQVESVMQWELLILSIYFLPKNCFRNFVCADSYIRLGRFEEWGKVNEAIISNFFLPLSGGRRARREEECSQQPSLGPGEVGWPLSVILGSLMWNMFRRPEFQ